HAAPQGRGSIAEDYQLAIDLLLAGHATRFVPEARVRSVLPARRDSAFRQRRRWEHGHLALVLRTAPALFVRGLCAGRAQLVLLALALCVPPLAFLALAWCLAALLALAAALAAGSLAAASVVALAGALLGGGVLAGLWRFAGRRKAFATLFGAPLYVL